MLMRGGVGKGLVGKREDSASADTRLIITRRGNIYMKEDGLT